MMTPDKDFAAGLGAAALAHYVDWTGFLLTAVRRFILLVAALPLALGVAAALSYVPSWESVKTVRLGFVDGKPAEVAPALQERINNRWFRDDVLAAIGLDPEDPVARRLRKGMSVGTVTPELVRMRAVGRSQEESARLLDALAARVEKDYEAVRESKVQALRARLAALEGDLAERRETLKKLGQSLTATTRAADALPGIAFLYHASQSAELKQLEDRIAVFRDRLGPETTWPTSTFVQTTTSEDLSAPSRRGRTLVAAGLGLAAAVLASFLLHWYLRRREARGRAGGDAAAD